MTPFATTFPTWRLPRSCQRSPTRASFAALVLLLALCPGARANDETPDLVDRVDALAKSLIDSGTVVGMTLMIIDGDQEIERGYGQMGPDDLRAPDGDTLFEIGSISKTFTALLLADAVQRGEVSLEDSVASLLPAGREILDIDPDDPIRLHHLSSHTSGLPRLPANMRAADVHDPYAAYSVDDLLDALENVHVDDTPGLQYAYSNLGAGLLGSLLVLRAGAASYEALLQERVLVPLELSDTFVTVGPSNLSRFAAPCDIDGRPGDRWHFQALAGAGAIRASVRDLARYGLANLRPEHTPLADAIELTHVSRHEFAPGQHIGLGWHKSAIDVLWHNGMTGGYTAFLSVDKERGAVVAILANTPAGQVSLLGDSIVLMMRGKEPKPLPIKASIAVSEDILDRYVGQYRMNPLIKFTITREGPRLIAELTGQPAFVIHPTSPTEFFYRVVEASITFEPGEGDAGFAPALVLHQNGADTRAVRIEKD